MVEPFVASYVFYDGYCGLCGRTVQFLMEHDREKRLVFVPLSSDQGKELTATALFEKPLPDSIIFLDSKGNWYAKSSAVIRTISSLSSSWSVMRLLLVVPTPIRDMLYTIVARNRYKLFGKHDSCFIPKRKV